MTKPISSGRSRSSRSTSSGTSRGSSRSSGKRSTRDRLIAGALKLLDGDKSFDGLSLRELTREVGIVPTGFYRHFADMEALGLTLVEHSFRALRQILADTRKDTSSADKMITAVVTSLLKHFKEQRREFRFIASERFGGSASVRDAIRRELRLVHSELALDLARFPAMREWSSEDLQMLSGLMLNSMVAVAEEFLERGAVDKQAARELTKLAEKQLRLIMLGVPQWRSAE